MTHPKNSSVFTLIIRAILNGGVWVLFSSLAGVLMAVLVVALMGSNGFIKLQALIQADYHAIAALASPATLLSLNTKLKGLPTQISLPSLSIFGLPLIKLLIARLHVMPLIKAAFLGLQLITLRLVWFMHNALLALLLISVASIDGLTQRAIRRYHLGRERALVYHQAKALFSLLGMLGVFLMLVLPVSPKIMQWIFLTTVLLLSITFQTVTKQFKKYL